MLVPAVVAEAGAGQLDEPHAALDQPPGEQALPGERRRALASSRRGRTAAASPRFRPSCPSGRARPSASGRPARSWRSPIRPRRRGPAARRLAASSCLSRASLFRCSSSVGFLADDVGDRRVVGGEDRALIRRRQKAAVEIVEPAGRNQAAVDHDEARQIAALAPQAVAEPGPHARPPLHAGARVQEVVGRRVLGKLAGHRANDRQLIDVPGDVRKQAR